MPIITRVLIARLFARAVISFRLRAIKQAHISFIILYTIPAVILPSSTTHGVSHFEEKAYWCGDQDGDS